MNIKGIYETGVNSLSGQLLVISTSSTKDVPATMWTYHLITLSGGQWPVELQTKAIQRFVITEKAPTRAFSWLKAATIAFTFKTLLRHYAKRALTPRSLNVKLGPRCKGHKGQAV